MKLTPDQSARLAELRIMSAKHEASWKRHAAHGRHGSCATPEQQAAIVADCGFDFTNALRAELQTLSFIDEPARPEFAYPSDDLARVLGFMGNTLARITWHGSEWTDNFGGKRRAFQATGINGARYVGTIFGTYLRMKPAKA